MWSTIQRVPSQPLSSSDTPGRTQVPGTPTPTDGYMGSQQQQQTSPPSMDANGEHRLAENSGSDGAGSGGHGYQQQQGQQMLPNRESRSNGNPDSDSSGMGGRSGDRPGQNGNGGGNGDSSSDSGSGGASGSDGEESEVEDLPQVTVDMIPLSLIVSRMVTFAYTELVTLVETLPSRTESSRREEILKYACHMREQLTKLLVLVRWAQNAPQIQKCQNVIAYLQSQNEYFTRSVDGLYATYLSLPQARVRNYDVSNAVDVLTTGTYQRLPSVIKETFAPPQKLTRTQVKQTLSAINDIIRGRILRGEPIPLAMRRYKISGGRITFTVDREFEVTLTLLQYTPNIPWHVVGVRVLVACDKSLPDEQQIRLDSRQMAELAQQCQAQLLLPDGPIVDAQPANDTASQQTSLVKDSSSSSGTGSVHPPQLARLYDYLHMQSLTIFLETIVKQAAVLKRTRWESLLQIEMSPDRSVLTLRYWTSPRAASSAHTSVPANAPMLSDNTGSAAAANGSAKEGGHQAASTLRGNSIVFRLCPLPVPRPIHASAVEGPDALEALPRDNANAERGEFLRIERDRRNLIPKVGLNVTWTAQSGLAAAKVWTRTVSQASEMASDPEAADSSGAGLVLDAETVNTEKLLRQVTWQHSRDVLQALNASVVASGLFDEGAVELLYVAASGAAKEEQDLTKEEADLATAVPKLRAWYRQNEGAVDITVDAYTGRLVVRASEVVSVSASLSETMISQLADQLNRSPWRLADLLVDMRSSLALADLDSLSFRSLGLRSLSAQCSVAPSLPGFVLSGICKRAELSAGPHGHHHPGTSALVASGVGTKTSAQLSGAGSQGTPHMGGLGHIGVSSPAMTPSALSGAPGMQQQGSSSAAAVAANFPLRVSQQEADALTRDVAGVDQPLNRIRFYKIEGTEGVEEYSDPAMGSAAGRQGKGEWYLMVAMTDRLRFRLVLLNPHPTDPLMYVVAQVISLQVDRLFSSVARRLLAEKALDPTIFANRSSDATGSKRNRDTTEGSTKGQPAKAGASTISSSERDVTERVDAMLSGRTSITLDYLNALASTCRARLALRLLQTQLTRWHIPYSFRIPSFSTSPHGHRAAVSKELSVVGLDKMGLYELDEQVPILYIPIAGLMRASPINWNVANQGVLPDEARRMVSIRIASDELDPSLRADLSPSTRVDQHRQAAFAKMAEGNVPFVDRSRSLYTPLSNSGAPVGGRTAGDRIDGQSVQHGANQPFIGRHVIPCQVIASIPVALDGLPALVAQAHADTVYFGAHAAADGGYHRSNDTSSSSSAAGATAAADERKESGRSKGGYSKMVLAYKQVGRALQCLIRDWSEHHLMMHIARQLYVWEQRTFRRVLASTTAYYPFNAGPYTAAVANMLGSWRGHQSTELVIQCVNSCFLSISCRVPYPFANDDRDKSLYPPGYQDSGGNDLSFHLTLAEVDPKTSQIIRIASTWPWVFSHTGRSAQEAVERNLGHEEHLRAHKMGAKNVGFELSTSLSRWLRTLQARINLTGNPLAALSIIVQLMPIHHVVSSISSQASIQSLLPSLQLGSKDSLIQLKFEGLLDGDEMDVSTRSSKAAPTPDRFPNAENKDEAARAAGERALPMEDQSHLVLRRLVYAHNYIRQAFESVADLNVMHMYTAADNIRLVFNSRYVVDLRLVSNDLLHLSDVVAAARSFAGPPTIYGGASVAPPAPLVTAATEPIPLFAEWLNNMSSSIKLNWEKLEKGVSALMRHVYIAAPSSSSSSSLSTGTGDVQGSADANRLSDCGWHPDLDATCMALEPGEKVRMFQRNMYRLRPDASKIEQFLFKFRELNNKQYSAKSPTFVPLPPSAILCSKSHLVPILRSLMQWILQSVHVLDSLESAIVKTQESFVHAMSGGVARHAVMLFSVDELLVDRQQMIVGFTGSRGSVRCEFVMKTGVKRDDAGEAGAGESATKDMDKSMSMDADGQQQQQQQTGDASASAYGNDDPVAPLLSGLFSVPENLMDVMWDVRILPIVHPPKGVSERVATFLAESFNKQKTSIGQRAGVLVRLAALPPHLLEDTAKIAVDMKGKVDVCAISEGHEYEIRLDAGKAEAMFTLRLCGSDQKTWARVVVVYALLTGVAQVRYVQYETPAREDVVQVRFKKTGDDGRVESVAMKPVDAWSLCLDGVVKKLDDMTAFTLDNGKDGKSRWFDIVSSLYAAQLEQLGL